MEAYTKYPRTFHLPWSEAVTSDDKVVPSVAHLEGREVIVTEKMDGENTTMYRDHIHSRSLDSKGGEDRAWVKQFWASIRGEIPEGWRICGENLWGNILFPTLTFGHTFMVLASGTATTLLCLGKTP